MHFYCVLQYTFTDNRDIYYWTFSTCCWPSWPSWRIQF